MQTTRKERRAKAGERFTLALYYRAKHNERQAAFTLRQLRPSKALWQFPQGHYSGS